MVLTVAGPMGGQGKGQQPGHPTNAAVACMVVLAAVAEQLRRGSTEEPAGFPAEDVVVTRIPTLRQ